MKTFKVRITKLTSGHWYTDRIGEVFDVIADEDDFYVVANIIERVVHKRDCEIVKDEPEQFMFQGYPLNVGDKLYDMSMGWATIEKIWVDDCYPIRTTGGLSYTVEGKSFRNSKIGQLYWDEPKFELPKKPKLKVKKYLVVYKTDAGKFGVSSNHYETLEKFIVASVHGTYAVQLILESEKEFDDE